MPVPPQHYPMTSKGQQNLDLTFRPEVHQKELQGFCLPALCFDPGEESLQVTRKKAGSGPQQHLCSAKGIELAIQGPVTPLARHSGRLKAGLNSWTWIWVAS